MSMKVKLNTKTWKIKAWPGKCVNLRYADSQFHIV